MMVRSPVLGCFPLPETGLRETRVGRKQKGQAEQVAPRASSLKICRFRVYVFPISPWRKYDSQNPFWRGLSGKNSGGRFAPGRFCLLPSERVFRDSGLETPNHFRHSSQAVLGISAVETLVPGQRRPKKVVFSGHFGAMNCDPDCLVQPPNSRTAPKLIGEGASGLFEGWPGNPENVSCSRATPRLHRCKSGVALEQETFSGLQGHPPKRPTCSFSYQFRGSPGIRGLYQAVRAASHELPSNFQKVLKHCFLL